MSTFHLSHRPAEPGCDSGATRVLARMKPRDFVFFKVDAPDQWPFFQRKQNLKSRAQCVRQLARQLRARTRGAKEWRNSTFLVSKIDDLNEISVYRAE